MDRPAHQFELGVVSRHDSPFSQLGQNIVVDLADASEASTADKNIDEDGSQSGRKDIMVLGNGTHRAQRANVATQSATSLLNDSRLDGRTKSPAPRIEDRTENEIDLTNDPCDSLAADYMDENEFRSWLSKRHEEETEQTVAVNPDDRSRSKDLLLRSRPLRNPSITAPLKRLDSYIYNGLRINPKANVELQDGDFLRVLDIIEDTTLASAVILRGWLFRRNRLMNGLLERKLNELCLILHVDENDDREPLVQAMVSVPVTSVKKRRKVKLTNQTFPALSFREDGHHSQDAEHTIFNERVLVCRVKYICSYVDAQARERYIWSEKAIHRLNAKECDPLLAEAGPQLRLEWRGPTEKGGCEFIEQPLAYPGEPRDLEDQLWSNPGPSTTASCTPEPSLPRKDLDQESLEDPSLPAPPAGRRGPKLDPDGRSHRTRRRKNNEPPTSIVDLTDNDNASLLTPSPTTSISTSDSIHSSIFELLSHHLAREDSTETVDIDLCLSTTTKAGTLKRRYQSRVTSTFSPRTSAHILNNDKMDDYAPERPRKKRRACREDKASTRYPSPSPASSERATGRSSFVVSSDSICNLPPEPGFSGCEASLPSPPSPVKRVPSHIRKYAFGDCFCGGGGMSRGAVMAGLKVEWGFDFNQPACETYALNFPTASNYNIWAHEFSALPDNHRCDICHLSPPCQFFSDAHTVMGKDDDMNTASLFAIMELLKKVKPRVVTLEQTSGLLRRHELYFNAVIQIFTSLGFSIRWRLINCADYGLPQRRWRIFIIASCPGEPLPPFPKPTHAANPDQTGLKPYATINQAIARIPSSASNHSPDTALPRSAAPYDGDTLARCITTGGGHMIHPSGTRDFTHREFACLQGFPLEHRFCERGVKKQIGNAVPPIVAMAILESVKKALMEEDGISEDEPVGDLEKDAVVELD